jgi:serine/threonine protein kinase
VNIYVDRVDSFLCDSCQGRIECGHIIPLTDIVCPHCGVATWVPGQFGHYLLREKLGEGGTGPVYRAQDTKLNRIVAIKVLHKVLSLNEDLVRFFQHQAKSAAALNHINVVKIYELGKMLDQHYIAMELIEGDTLRDLINEDDISEEEALQIGLGIAEGLHAAEESGLVHGDVRPKNIFISDEGVPKIADFGLARSLSKGSARPYSWVSPYYTAPERFSGVEEDTKGDIYGLGATLFHALIGRPPFDDPEPEQVIEMKTTLHVPDIRVFQPEYREETALIVARMLEREPARRYPTYSSLIADLNHAISAFQIGETSIAATQRVEVLSAENQEGSTRRKPSPAILAGLAAVVVAVLAIVLFPRLRLGNQTPPPPDPEGAPPLTQNGTTTAGLDLPEPAVPPAVPPPSVEEQIAAFPRLSGWWRPQNALAGSGSATYWPDSSPAGQHARIHPGTTPPTLVPAASPAGMLFSQTTLGIRVPTISQGFWLVMVCRDIGSSTRSGNATKTLIGNALPLADPGSLNLFLDRDFANNGGIAALGQVRPDSFSRAYLRRTAFAGVGRAFRVRGNVLSVWHRRCAPRGHASCVARGNHPFPSNPPAHWRIAGCRRLF